MKLFSLFKPIVFGLLFFLFFINSALSQAEINVTYRDGNVAEYNIESSGKIYFQENTLFIMERHDSPVTISIPSVRKITLVSEPVDIENYSQKRGDYRIYPNPVQSAFRIKSSSPKATITVELYSINGSLLFSKVILLDETIDVSNLASGLYLVKIDDVTLKMSKL